MMKVKDMLQVEMDFPETLRMWREKRYLTQIQLAEKAMIGITSVRAYETGKVESTLGALKLLSKALNISVSTLVKNV